MEEEVVLVCHLMGEGVVESPEDLVEALGVGTSHIGQIWKEGVLPHFSRLVETVGEEIPRSGGKLGCLHIRK